MCTSITRSRRWRRTQKDGAICSRSFDQPVAVRQPPVTAIRLDGVEEPAFRHPSATDRPLAAVGRVDVETTPLAAFVRQCCADAEDAVGEVATRVPELTSHRMVEIVRP
jgi:hypothetical protein